MERKNYTQLVAWQSAMQLVERIYQASERLPAGERYGLAAQMRRSAVSIPANIAEGQGRRTCGEFVNQLSAAHGSTRELETHLMLASRLGMLDEQTVKELLDKAGEVGRLVAALLRALDHARHREP